MEPAGKEEARRTRLGHVYKPLATRRRMNQIKEIIRSCYKGPLLDEPVALEIRTWRTRPKRIKKGTWYAPVKPDWDNIGKLISDCLENTVVVNDSRIVHATVIKFFAGKGQSPCIEFTLSKIPAQTTKETEHERGSFS